ncbi:hypothetical protein G9A89_016042 [Geosiphon pyriformis]|nr:hypothetical protein G9A89_016042 [Geosiphon pyriformis]
MATKNLSTISTKLPIYDTIANILTTNLLALSTCHLSIAVPIYLSAANPKTETDTTKLEIVNNSSSTDSQFFHASIWIMKTEFGHQVHLKPKFSELFKSSALTNNILLAVSTKNKLLATIFPFDFDKITPVLLFSRAILNTKPITAMYTDAKVDGIPINAAWKQAVKHLNGCSHNDDKIWQMAFTKIKEVLPEEIKRIKNNLPESIELNWDPKPVINLLNPKQFHKHYQELALTREEQKQQLEKINT